jgi:hypothetical protein
METEKTKNIAELNLKEVILIVVLVAIANFLGIWLAQKLT